MRAVLSSVAHSSRQTREKRQKIIVQVSEKILNKGKGRGTDRYYRRAGRGLDWKWMRVGWQRRKSWGPCETSSLYLYDYANVKDADDNVAMSLFICREWHDCTDRRLRPHPFMYILLWAQISSELHGRKCNWNMIKIHIIFYFTTEI